MTSSARFYALISTGLGTSGMVWRATGSVRRFERIFLPRRVDLETLIRREYPDAVPGKAGSEETAIRKILAGEAASFDLKLLAFERLPDFHAAVLRAQIRVQRGFVTTYGRLAAAAGRPGAARAAGHALATNPFPPVVPCHRTLRADGSLGGFGGGLALKRALLESEGVRFDSAGRVEPCHIVS
ncbi:MAG: methylated-DNA--[protein]-cysteine S-methyltransferase [Syntrophales bacterium]|jgi:methylated-DNA-[protein]-cysteine S-methyltransferase|nr:methylated-DNA--[protein]-cysteine S-methyltransferase [Syntrophales bacterium]